MQEYYFLFGLAFVWIVFAVVQDLRTREVANWLNFSLIAFVLAYRGFYAVVSNDLMFFVHGLFGVGLFVVLAYAFYYGKVFAGGDAKLLMGLGGILPVTTLHDYLILGGGFVFLLFSAGAVWTLLYSAGLVHHHRKAFVKAFQETFMRNRLWVSVLVVFGVVFGVVTVFNGAWLLTFLAGFIVLFPWLYVYVKAVDVGCMIQHVPASKLTEGDWLERDVRVGRTWIRKSVHGLSRKDILLLQKARKKVWIKEGVPFTPAFLLALLIGVWAWIRFL